MIRRAPPARAGDRAATLGRVLIRRAVARDLDSINAVHTACRRSEWPEALAHASEHRCVLVALVEGVVVAAAKTHLQTEPAGAAPAGHFLGGVSVHPDHRRRGIGSALTRARIDWVWERSDVVYYFTDDDNAASMRMHAAYGFQGIARSPTLLGARATHRSLVLFRAVRPPRVAQDLSASVRGHS